nr:MAG TPA: hypothetical protein [Caudoviricetes sp.]
MTFNKCISGTAVLKKLRNVKVQRKIKGLLLIVKNGIIVLEQIE